MYPYVEDDDDAEEDEDEESPREYRGGGAVDTTRGRYREGFDDLTAINSEVDQRRRKRQLLEEIQRKEDEEYDGEWGYALIKALRGKSVGRRLRRKLFKFGLVQILCGIPVTIMAYMANRDFTNTGEWDSTKYGSSLIVSALLFVFDICFVFYSSRIGVGYVQRLTSVVGYPSIILGAVTLMAVRHWATLVSNRKLLGNLMRIYQFLTFIMFVLVLWTVCAVLMTFGKRKDWSESARIAQMLPYFVCLCIFLFPYVSFLLLYTLDVSYLTDEVEKGGPIEERDPPPYARDLSDVTLFQSCIYVCGMPVIICIQISDLIVAVRQAYHQYYQENPPCCRMPDLFCLRKKTMPASEAKKKPKGKTIWHRIYRTIVRCFRGSKQKPVVLPMTQQGPTGLPLKELDKDREAMERNEREVKMYEEDEERRQFAQREAAEAERLRDRIEAASREVEAEKLRLEQEAEMKRQELEYQQRWQAVLSVADFKEKWAAFPTSGSFQCNLKSMPDLNSLCEHLKRQGFHIVFALTPSATDVEIGICNIRPVDEHSWFMARFLASKNAFSAVMKSDNAQMVPALVKRFALAKVLRIDGHGSKG